MSDVAKNSPVSKKILLIDDDELLRNALVGEFKAAGYTVLEAANGRDGLAAALKEHPDIILLDQIMPVMSGLEMLKQLRSNEWGVGVPVILATNLTTSEAIDEAIDAGANEYFVKSEVSVTDILNTINDRLRAA